LAAGGLAALARPDDLWTYVLGIVAVLVGVTGLIAPAMVRPVYTGWMIVAFRSGGPFRRLRWD
jgi:hypothetical protein